MYWLAFQIEKGETMYIPYIYPGGIMKTKVFKSGNSIAVRIPKELAGLTEAGKEVLIEKVGDNLVIRSAERTSLAGIGKIFAQFSPDFMSQGRDMIDEREIDWDKTLIKIKSES